MSFKSLEIPKEFKNLKKPPKRLYYSGNKELLNSKKISVVGSRHPISYTKTLTSNLCASLKRRGVCVVSGGAMGVDAIAHKNSYPNTIAVMASSLDNLTPKVNLPILKKISQNALIISEQEEGYQVRSYDFVLRNRLVVALGEVLVIAEADENSGSLKSAEIALELGKEIFVFPHRLSESRGTNELLKSGLAKPIYDIEKFCDMFGKIEEKRDEFLEFCKINGNLDEIIEKFGDLVYEYELEGRVKIENMRVTII